MKKLLALLLASVMVFALFACTQSQGSGEGGGDEITEEMKYGGHLNIASINISGRLDPSNVGGVYHFPNLIWESPLSRDADGNVAPGVCDFELSEDQLTLKLWVIEGKKFHDGTDVEIEDVVASIMRKGHKSPVQYVQGYLAEPISVKDGVATLKFSKYSEKTMSYIASTRTLMSVLPKEFCEKYIGVVGVSELPKDQQEGVVGNNSDVVDAIGTGPYKVDSKRDGEWIKLTRFDGYVKNDAKYTGAAAPRNAYFDSITFWNISDQTASKIQVLANDIDVFSLDMTEYKEQLPLNHLAQTQTLGSKTKFLLFNTKNKNNQIHDDVNLRKAICAAIDFEEIAAEMWNGLVKLGGAPAQDGAYYIDTWDKADYMGKANVELAKQYLAKSNYKGEKLYYATTDANFAALIESYLKPAGINLDIQVKESDTEHNTFDGSDWNFTFWQFSAGQTPSTMAPNSLDRAWDNAEKDAKWATITSTVPGSDEYMKAWKDLAQIWVDDCASPYIGQEMLAWTHHEDLVMEYVGTDAYIWNWYWKNPADHAEK